MLFRSMTVYQPNSYWSVNSNPFSEWRSFAGVTGSANVALELIANDLFGGGGVTNSGTLTGELVYRGPYDSESSGSSILLFGGCLPASVGAGFNCSEATANSFTGSAFRFRNIDNTNSWMPIITYRSLYKSAMNYEQADIGADGDGRRVVGGQVGIQAKYIDINGTISSGMATNRSVTISEALNTWISQHGCANGLCVEAVDIPTHLLTASGGQPIGAKYDFVNQRIVLDDVNASGGGFIYMRGGIISTNPTGRIEVNNGFGEVTIDNRSAHQLQLGDIDTGVGSVGIVQIVDTFKKATGGRDLSTWYVHDQNSGLSVYDNRNGASSVLDAHLVSSSSASSATYNPLDNLRFEWTQEANLSRTIIRDGDNLSVSNWAWNYVSPNDPWTVSAGQVVVRDLDNVYEQHISGSLGSNYNFAVNYHGCDGGIGSSCNWDFKASGRYPAGHARAGEYYAQWVYQMPRSATLTIDHSVKADNPFAIAFVGNSTGLIDAKTNNNLIIGGRLSNAGGLTRLQAAGNIINGSDGTSFSHQLDMTAGGYIGQTGRAVVAGLAAGGTLSAVSGAAGINLDLTSDVLVRNINAGNGLGDVVVRVNGNLGAIGGLAAGSAHVTGRNLDLYATGAIGSGAAPLRVIAQEQATAGGGSTHGNLNAFAVRDVFLNEIEGDAWVGQIVSETGDVWLKVDNGSLYDAGQRLASDTLDETQRQQIWEKLKLTSEYGAEANIQQGTVKPFEDQVVSQYREYWRLKELGSLQGDTFVLAEDSLDFYRPLAELQAGRTGLSDAEVQSYAAERYNGHALFFAGVFGEDWAQQTAFQSLRTDFSYTASAEQIAALTHDAIWTEGELRYAIDSTAMGSASSTPVGAADPNVVGRNVTLITSQDIGRLADSLLINFDDLRSGNLTPPEAAALAIANAPGDVLLNRDDSGQVVSLQVNRTQPFYVAASERFDATTGGALYLQSAGDLNIGTVRSGGDARLAAATSILASNGAGSLIVGGDLTLLAGTGNLGTVNDDDMLSLDVAGRLLSASAGQHIGLRWLGDDFRIGRVFAVGDLRLDAPNGSLLGQYEGLAITGQNIQLNARDDILGLDGAALVIDQASVEGELGATAGGDIRLSNTGALHAGVIRAGGNLYLDAASTLSGRSLHADGDLHVTAPEAMDLQQLSAGGNLLVSTLDTLRLRDRALAGGDATWMGASLSMDAGSRMQAAGLLAISTDGDMSLGQLFRAGQADGALFNLRAGGRIDANGDGQVNLRAERTGSAIVQAEQGIGRVDQALLVDLPELTRTETRQGDIVLRNLSALSGTLMSAENGSISLGNAGQGVQLGSMLAADNIHYRGGDLQVDVLEVGGWLQAQMSGDLHLGQAEVGEWAELVGSSADARLGWDTLNVGQSLQVRGPGHWYGDSATAGQDVQFNVGSADLGELESAAGNLLLQAAGNFAAVGLHSPQGRIQLQAGSVELGTAATAGALSVHSLGDLTLFNGRSGDDMTLTTESGSLGSIRFGLEADAGAVNGLQPADLYSDANILIQTDGDIVGGNAEAQGTVQMTGRNLRFGRAESLTADVLLHSQGAAAQGHGNLNAFKVHAGNDVVVHATGNLDVVNVDGASSLRAGRDLDAIVAGNLNVTGAAEAARNVNFQAGGTSHLDAVIAGRSALLHSDGAVKVTDGVTAGGEVTITSVRGGITMGTGIESSGLFDNAAINGDVTLSASGDITLPLITAGNGAITASGHDLTLGQLSSTGDIMLRAAGDLSVDQSLSAGSQNWQAEQGTVTAGDVQAAGDWYLTAGQAQIDTAVINGDVDAVVSGDLRLNALSAASALFDVGSASHIGKLDLVDSLGLQVSGALNLLTANVGGAATLQHTGAAGTRLHYGELNIGDSLTVTGLGDWSGDSALVNGQVHFDVGSAELGRLQSTGGDVLLNVARSLTADELHSDSQSIDVTSGGAQLGNVSAATTLSVHTTADDLLIGAGTSGGDLTLTTQAGSLANIAFGPLADPATPNVLAPAHLTSGANILVDADGDVLGGNAEAQGLLRMIGRNLHLGRAQSLQGDVELNAVGDAQQGHGNISALKVDAERDIRITATGNLDVVNVDADGAPSLRAGRDLSLDIGGALNVTGLAQAGRDLTFITGGDITSENIIAGRNVRVASGGSVELEHGVEAGGNVQFSAADNLSMGTGILSHGRYDGQPLRGDVVLEAGGNMDVPTITAANGVIRANGHDLRLGQLMSSQVIELLATGGIRVGSSQSLGDQNWQAEEDIQFDQLLTQGQALLDSLLDTRGGVLRADQGAALNAGWRNGVAGNGSIVLDQAQAPWLTLWAGKGISLADARIDQWADLHGQDIVFHGRHTGPGSFNLRIAGSGQQFADRLMSEFDAAHIVVSQFHVSDSQLSMTGDQLDIQDAQGVDRMSLQTGQAVIRMDNGSPAYQSDADIQLYELDRAFSFQQNGVTSTTNAYVLHRVSTHLVLVPNYMEEHEAPGGIEYQDMTGARYAEQLLSTGFSLTRLGSLLNAAALRRAPDDLPLFRYPARADQRMNLDLPEQPATSDEVRQWVF